MLQTRTWIGILGENQPHSRPDTWTVAKALMTAQLSPLASSVFTGNAVIPCLVGRCGDYHLPLTKGIDTHTPGALGFLLYACSRCSEHRLRMRLPWQLLCSFSSRTRTPARWVELLASKRRNWATILLY